MNWLMDKLGYVSKKEANAVFYRYRELMDNELGVIVERHKMQGAWSTLKNERSQARIH